MDNWRFPPHLYATYQFSERLSFGLGVLTPFGLAIEFPASWPGRFSSYDAEVQSININPTVAYKLTDNLSLAFGVDIMWFDINLKQYLSTLIPTLSQTLSGDSVGYGWNAGILYKPCPYASIGIAYRSQVKQDIDGTAEFSQQIARYGFVNKSASSSITLPDQLFLGLTLYPIRNLSWEIGGVWTRWSDFKQLSIKYASPILGSEGPTNFVTAQKNWRDVWRFQTGLEYKVASWLDLRVGYIYDTEAIRDQWADYLLPSYNRQFFSFGPGFHWQQWTLDLSYTYLMVEDHTVVNSQSRGYINPSRIENGNAQLIGVSLGYKF